MSDMEEGELSDHENVDFPPNDNKGRASSSSSSRGGRRGGGGGGWKDHGSSRSNLGGGLQVTFENLERDLPDLVRSVDDGGLSGLDRTCTERMEARAKRFNMGSAIGYDDIIQLYESFGIPAEEHEGTLDKSQRKFRLEAIHVRGFENMMAEDIYEYFKEFNPVSFEWVDAQSANVIWALASSSAKAILSLSRPLIAKEDEAMEVNERVVDEDGEEEKTQAKVLTKEELLARFGTDLPIYTDEIEGTIPSGAWRVGKPSQRDTSSTILMRIATMTDQAGTLSMRDENFFQERNHKLIQKGGVISASRKRKLHDIVMYDREAFEESERQKKYTGPVGKNPWGSIAKEWSSGPKPRDFADELQMFASQRGVNIGGRGGGGGGGGGGGRDVRSRLGGIKDWDAPDEEVEEAIDPISASLHRRSDRSPSPLGEPVLDSDDESKWSKKLKRPRMTMVADEVQSKASAKSRLFAGIIKRKITNHAKIEIFEEDDDDDQGEEPALRRSSSTGGLGLRMTVNAANTNADDLNVSDASGKHMNERFPGKAGRGSVMARLGRRESGDSLERDTGDDLRGELDGRHAANMVIQVPQSELEDEQQMQEDEEDEEEEIPEERTVRKARPESIIQRPIKQEKDLVPLPRKQTQPQASEEAVDRKRDVREKIREKEREKERERERDREREKEREDLRRRREQTRETVRHRDVDRRREERGEHREDRDHRPRTGEEKRSSELVARRRDSAPSRDSRPKSGGGGGSSSRSAKPKVPGGVRIKKEKMSDDEDSSESSSSSSSSSDDDDDDVSSTGSSSSGSDSSDSSDDDSSSDSSSSSDSDSSDDGKKRRGKNAQMAKKKLEASTNKKKALSLSKSDAGGDRRKREDPKDKRQPAASERGRTEKDKDAGGSKKVERKKEGDSKKATTTSSSSKDSKGLKDKLTEYLKHAKEKKRAGKK